jgi:ribosome biogenesis GTPase A
MTAARKKAAESMADIDVVIEVLDARIPEASSNPMIHQIRKQRQRACLKLLNKADLADPAATKAWLEYFNAQPGVKAVAISCKKAGEVARVPSLCQSLAPHRNDNFKPLRMIIMGIPNVGKSTLMNALLKRKVAAVGDQPAVTKSQQTLDITPRQKLTDTPGLMWPRIDYESDGLMLAASHAIGVNAYIDEEVATFLAGILLERYAPLLAARYKTDVKAIAALDAVGLLELIAKKRGCLIKGKGGELDLERASQILMQDYRDGVLGRISLETPATRAEMVARSQQLSNDPEGDAEAADSAAAGDPAVDGDLNPNE